MEEKWASILYCFNASLLQSKRADRLGSRLSNWVQRVYWAAEVCLAKKAGKGPLVSMATQNRETVSIQEHTATNEEE